MAHAAGSHRGGRVSGEHVVPPGSAPTRTVPRCVVVCARVCVRARTLGRSHVQRRGGLGVPAAGVGRGRAQRHALFCHGPSKEMQRDQAVYFVPVVQEGH